MVVTTIIYLYFSVTARTFKPALLAAFLGSVVCGMILLLSEIYMSDFLAIVTTTISSIALCLFILDSVGDITDFVCGIVMYGNPDNVPFRLTIIGICLIGNITAIAGNFMKRIKEV